MELIHVFTTPLIEELERQGWTWAAILSKSKRIS